MSDKSHIVDELRRKLLKTSLVGPGFVMLPRESESRTTPSRQQSRGTLNESLLPADKADAIEPVRQEQPIDGELGEATVVNRDVNANPEGELALSIEGGLDGAGKFSFDVFPYLETTWTAPETGEYVVTVKYDAEGKGQQIADEEGYVSALTILESNLSIIDEDDNNLTEKTVQDHRAVNENHFPEYTEEAVMAWARGILRAEFGPVVGTIVWFFVEPFVEDIIDIVDESGQAEKEIHEDGQIQASFRVEQGGSYRIRFFSNGTFLGSQAGQQAVSKPTSQLTIP